MQPGVEPATTDGLRCVDSPEESSGTDDDDDVDMEFSVKDEEESIVSDTDYIPPSERGGYNTHSPKNNNLTVKVTRFTAATEEGIPPSLLSYVNSLISIV